MNARSGITKARLIWAAAIIAVLIVVGYKVFLNQSDKDSVNLIATAIGVQRVIPWEERAISITKVTIENSRANLATSIVGLTHPSAEKPNLSNYSVTNAGDVICVRLQLDFVGGFSGTKYSQIGEWKFSKTQNFGYIIISDNAPFAVDQEHMGKVNTFFQAEMYPVTLGNIH